MNRLVCILLAFLALPSVKPAWIRDQKEYAVITQLTHSFAISEDGEAQTEVMVTTSMSDTIIIHIRIERKIGIFWQKVPEAEWTDQKEDAFYSTASHSVPLEKDGTYRAVMTVSLQKAGESQKKRSKPSIGKKRRQPRLFFRPAMWIGTVLLPLRTRA